MKHSRRTSFCILHSAFCLAAAAAFGAAPSPYGVCAHLCGCPPAERPEECRWIAATGIDRVRFDIGWRMIQRKKDAPFDFSWSDAVMADLEANGLKALPILNYAPSWARPAYKHVGEWERFVEALVSHYGDRFDEIEVWNEQNCPGAFGDWNVSPTNYFHFLRATYAAAKRANPNIRVIMGGTASVPINGYFDKIYDMGGAACFDAMNVHPYTHPLPPERSLDTGLERLRAFMDSRGDAGKPIIVSEMGWPTHDASVSGLHVLPPALKVAKPDQKTWRAVFAATMPGPDGKPPADLAEAIEKVLPPGSTVEACFGARLKERLAAGDVDLVIYPLDESFPADTFNEVAAFVEGGGVLADLGGMPMYYSVRESAPGLFERAKANVSSMLRRLRMHSTAFWFDDALPDGDVRAFPTEAALAAGFQGDPAGEKRGSRYQTASLLWPGDEFIPLLTVRDKKGRDAVVASVARLAGGTNGCVIVSGFMTGRAPSAGEDGQARYVARSLALAMAVGVEQFYYYEFRSPELDPLHQESHFGLTHRNFTPKPAWGAYRNFVLARPVGSVQTPGPWHDEKREFYFPQWTRPDGVKAGILWKTGAAEKRTLRFDGGKISFRDYTGRVLKPVSDLAPPREGSGYEVAGGSKAGSAYLVPLSGDPIYFEGGALLP